LTPGANAPGSPVLHVPKITDFGLARRLEQTTGLTQTGVVVGTPQYMAPEQVRGASQATIPADIYALGAILYELLTGRPPFQGLVQADLLFQVLNTDPVPPQRLQAGVPRDLETICQKCLHKEPQRRYGSARELAEDLAAFQESRSIRARPAGPWERGRLWARRRPAVAALLALVVLVTVVGFGLVSWQWYEADSAWRAEGAARSQAETQRKTAEGERRRAQVLAASLALDQGTKHCQEGRVGTGLLWMARALGLLPPGEDDLEYTIRLNLAAWRGSFASAQKGPAQQTAVTAIALSPDGETVLTGNWGSENWVAGSPAKAHLWALSKWGQQPQRTVTHPGTIWSVAFSPDGQKFAVGGEDGTARLWKVTGGPIGAPLPHGGRVFGVAFSPDGKVLAVGSRVTGPKDVKSWPSSEVGLWDTTTATPAGQPMNLPGLAVNSLAWRPDGRSLAVGGILGYKDTGWVGGGVLLLDVAGRRIKLPALLHTDTVTAVAFHPNGATLATACQDGNVRFWSTQTQRRLPAILEHGHPLGALAFSKDGRVLATGGGEQRAPRVGPGVARLWDLASGQPLVGPLVHRETWQKSTVHAVAVGPDNRTVLTASENGYAWLWTAVAPSRPLAVLGPNPEPWTVAFSPDGKQLLWTFLGANERESPDKPSDVRLFDAVKGVPTGVALPHPTAPQFGVQFSPDGRRVLTVSHYKSREHVLRLWDAANGEPIRLPPSLAEGVTWADFSRDGKALLVGGQDGKLRWWDSTTLAPLGEPLAHSAAIRWAVQAPDGRTVMIASADHKVTLWTPGQGKPIGTSLTRPGFVHGQGFFTADSCTAVVLWSRPQAVERVICRYGPDGEVIGDPWELGYAALTPGPDGNRFLVRTTDTWGALLPGRLWDATTGASVELPFPPHDAVAFHPSGRFVALGSGVAPHAHLWSVVGKPIGPPIPHPGPILGVKFNPAGRMLATAGTDHLCRLWKVPDPVAGTPAEVRDLVEVLTSQELDEAGGPRDLKPVQVEERRQRLGDGGGGLDGRG
jgi:WD40 repeat protein